MGLFGTLFTAHCAISGYSIFHALAEDSKTVVLPKLVAAASAGSDTSKHKAAVRQVLRMYKGNADYALLRKQYSPDSFSYDDPLLSFQDRVSFTKASKMVKKLRPVEISHREEYSEDQVIIHKIHQVTVPILKRQVMLPSTTVLEFDDEGKICRHIDYWHNKEIFTLKGVDIGAPSRQFNGFICKALASIM